MFIPYAEVHIGPNFDVADAKSACLFVGGEEVIFSVNGGLNVGNPPVDTDLVKFALITDGTYRVQFDSNYEALTHLGFVFANRTEFNRDLVLADNYRYPTTHMRYDPRYLRLFKDMLGRIEFESFECGLVTGSDSCLSWDELY